MSEKLVKNSTWSYAAKLAATVLFFAADILIARILDLDQYAEWAFFYAVLSMICYFFWFGVNGSAKVFVSKTLPRQERRILCIQAGMLTRTAVTLALALLGGCILLLAPRFSFFRELVQKYPDLQTLLLLSPCIAGMNSFVEFFKENEIGVQQYRGVFALTAAEYAMILIAGVLGALLFRSAAGVGYGYLSAYTLTFLLGTVLIRKWNGVRTFWNGSRECRQYAKKIFKYAIPLALIGIGGIILVEMDTFMLGLLSTPENVANYAIAKQICTKASHINNALAMGTVTAFSVITAADYPQKRKTFARVARINALVTLAAAGAMFILSDFAIKTLYGGKYTDAAMIIRCLVPFYILYGLSAYYALFLDFHEKAGMRSLWYLIMVGINFILNLLLIPRYGTAGACLATAASLIPYTLFLFYASYHLVWRELRKQYEKA